MTRKFLGSACKHAFQSFHKFDKDKDLITAKITDYYDDGTEESYLKLVEDYKVDFYIVKPKYRTFKDQRDYIELGKVKQFKSNMARLAFNISKVLYGRNDRSANLGEMLNSPYVFGCQEPAEVKFKQWYYDNFPEQQTTAKYKVGAYDVETWMEGPREDEINMASVTCEDKVVFAACREFYPDKDDETILRKLKEAQDKYLDKEYIKKYNIKFKYILVDKPSDVVINVFRGVNYIGPDYLVSWNANFDMSKNEEAIIKDGYDPAKVYSDPKVPDVYKDYKYFKGREFKRKVDGSKTALDNEERFPVLSAPAKWIWFDGMSFYAISRAAGGKKESYALQYTAKEEGIMSKLYTEEGSHLEAGSADWHRYMQKYHPYIYSMYNIQDNWVIEELNRKTQDYSLALPSLITSSLLQSYQSQPTLISDELSFIALRHGYVWGTVGRDKKDKFKDIKPDLKDWIALLHTEMNEDNGIYLYAGLPRWRSRGHHSVSDIDVTGAYPHVTVALNVSNFTTMLEVCKVDGWSRVDFRKFGINYASGVNANAINLAHQLYKMPTAIEIKDLYFNVIAPGTKKEMDKVKNKV